MKDEIFDCDSFEYHFDILNYAIEPYSFNNRCANCNNFNQKTKLCKIFYFKVKINRCKNE